MFYKQQTSINAYRVWNKQFGRAHCKMSMQPILLIHGGAGTISDDRVEGKFIGLKRAIRESIHHLIPENGSSNSSALDAVEAAIKIMECDKNFNAGYGSVLNLEGKVEVEASIMEGKHLKAGCVTLLHDIMHPISVARVVMENTKHTFLGGSAAQNFAINYGFEQLPGVLFFYCLYECNSHLVAFNYRKFFYEF